MDNISISFSLPDIYFAGYTIDELKETGYSLGDGKYAGFTLEELRASGGIALSVLAAQRRIDGASASSMAADGFVFSELQEAGYDLIGMLSQSTDSFSRIDAAICIRNIASGLTEEDLEASIRHDVIPPLITMLQPGCSDIDCKIAACGALESLAHCSSNKGLIASAGGIPALVALLQTGSDSCKEASMWALRSLARENASNMTAIALAGAIDPLVYQLLYGSDAYKESAARALCHLACDSSNTSAIASAGAITPLIELLSHENERL